VPSRNQPLTDDEHAAIKARYRQLRDEQYASFRGALHGPYLVLRQWRDGKSSEVSPAS
jgi:hypothetical protein